MNKELVEKYLPDLVNSEKLAHLFVVDTDKTTLHKYILLTNEYDQINRCIIEHIEKVPHELNVVCNGYTPLQLACLNYDTCSSEKTVMILTLAMSSINADLNLKKLSGIDVIRIGQVLLKIVPSEYVKRKLTEEGLYNGMSTKQAADKAFARVVRNAQKLKETSSIIDEPKPTKKMRHFRLF